jgi:hypothetical protein
MGMRTVGTAVGTLAAVTLGMSLLTAPSASGAEVAGAPGVTPTVLQLQVDSKRLGPSDRLTLSARLLSEGDLAPIGDAEVRLQYQRIGRTGWLDGETAVTRNGGRAEWTLRLDVSTRFRVLHPESDSAARSTSPVRKVYVKPVVRTSLKRDWVRPDGVVKLTGEVRPAYATERVSLQRRVDGSWRTAARTQQGGQGRFVFRVGGMPTYGPQVYRVALESRKHHLAAASKPVRLTTVRLVRYHIETRGKVRGALDSFRERTAEIYADPRGWSRANVHFKRVKSGGAFSLVLSQAKYVPTFAPICSRYYSCRVGRYVIINEDRWRRGTPYFKKSGGTLREYRAMVVNHETGHWFGLGHASCGGAGQLAPVMMQQSKGLYGCKPNPWPLAGEIARAY